MGSIETIWKNGQQKIISLQDCFSCKKPMGE
jgi:hypothetical protein